MAQIIQKWPELEFRGISARGRESLFQVQAAYEAVALPLRYTALSLYPAAFQPRARAISHALVRIAGICPRAKMRHEKN